MVKLRNVRYVLFVLALGTLLVTSTWAEKPGVMVTVYNNDLGLVREYRELSLKEGTNVVRFTDVAAKIDPTSVHFASVTDPDGTVILEQNFEYDLVSATRLLQKYIDNKIAVVTEQGERYEGVLQSFDERNLVLGNKDGTVALINRKAVRDVSMPKLPSGLITRPTLVWMLRARKGGKHLCELSYLTTGIKWRADYVLVVSGDDKHVDLSGWVTIDNQSGTSYEDALIKLIAGDVHRVMPVPRPLMMRAKREYALNAAGGAQQFQEKKFFEYHMYTLQRRATIADRQTKQISLLSADNVPVRKLYVYNGERSQKKVNVKLEFENRKANHLGMPLPKGKIRVYKTDPADKTLQFVGEDSIDHTPKDEKVRVYVGDAFDIVGERKQINTRRITAKIREFTFQITLRNHKDKAVQVVIEENPWAWQQWEIVKSSHEYVKKSQKKLEFPVNVPANGKTVVTYTIRYTSP